MIFSHAVISTVRDRKAGGVEDKGDDYKCKVLEKVQRNEISSMNECSSLR